MFSRSQQGTPPPVAHSSSNAIPAFFGQAFIVTNCASILGRATAHHLAEQGANLALCVRVYFLTAQCNNKLM